MSALQQSQLNRSIRRVSERMFMPLALRSQTLRASAWVGIVPVPRGDAGPSSGPLKRNELDDPGNAGPAPVDHIDVDRAQAERVGADDLDN